MKFTPKGNTVLIRPTFERENIGQLARSDHSKKKPMFGEVLAVGPGRLDEKMTTKVGEKVIYPQHTGVVVQLDGEDHVIIDNGAIYGNIDDD